MQAMSDGELAVMARDGSQEAFGELAQRWGRPLVAFVRRRVDDDQEALELAQEAFLRAWTRLDGLREPAHLKTWLHSIALNLARDHGRSAGSIRLRRVEWTEHLPEPVDNSASPAEQAEGRDRARAVQRALAQLPEDQRTALVLREYEGFSSAEIARILGVPAATVRSRIFYGLKTLRRLLPAEVGGTSGREGGSP